LSQRITVSGLPSTVNYVYDAANRLASVDGVAYTYDNNGNLLDDGVNTYTYDGANRLTVVSNQSSVVSYRYSGLGDRLQQTVNGQTTTFIMDLASSLTQVLDDGTNTYLYGNGRIAQESHPAPGTSHVDYFLTDALGSVRQMTNASGNIVLAKSYDPYGVSNSTSGTNSTSYGFTGEQNDPTGMVYLRARYYAPGAGRFMSRDTWGGDENIPMSYNKWLYAYSQPVNYFDPSGLSTTNSVFAVFVDDYDARTNRSAPHWSQQTMNAASAALGNIANAYAEAYDLRLQDDCLPIPIGTPTTIDPFTAFFKIHHGRITITWQNFRSPETAWGRAISLNEIWIYKDAPLDRMSQEFDPSYPLDALSGGRLGRFITHEMGHVFENAYERVYHTKPGRDMVTNTAGINNRDGFAGRFLEWQWSSSNENLEIYADMFLGWVDDHWRGNSAGVEKSTAMKTNMPLWITEIITGKK